MDHNGQIEKEGRMMSEADNLPKPEILSVQTQNLNETEKQTLLANEERSFIQQVSLNNNGNVDEVVKKGATGWDEEEDFDEVMKEEEEESEGSSCLIRCQSPDTPMTDSSFSETASLLETPYPLSPGTSPEPTSPIIPNDPQQVVYPIMTQTSQKDLDVNSHILNTGSGDSATESVPFSNQTRISSTGSKSLSGCTDVSDKMAKSSPSELLTSTSEPIIPCGPSSASSSNNPRALLSDPKTLLTALTKSNSSIGSISERAEPPFFTTRPETVGTELPSSLNQGEIASTSVIASTGSISTPALLQSLEQLIQRGDDSHLPQYLHQIAEAFVLCEDYQRALSFVQLERLYHQRVLDNLNALQKHWESQCGGTSSELATSHLDTLKHICQTHTRPRTKDAEQKCLDLLRPKSEEDSQHTCNSAHQVEGGMEQKSEDSLCPVISSENLPESLNFGEVFEEDRENPSIVREQKNSLDESQLTDKQDRDGGEEEGGAGCRENGLHPPTAVQVDQSKPAEQQRQDSDQTPEKNGKGEEDVSEVEEATEALEMEDEEAEDEAEERQTGGEMCLQVETLVSGAEVEIAQINQDVLDQEMLLNDTQKAQESSKTGLHVEAHPPPETYMEQQEEYTEEKEDDWDYDRDQADIIREASTLDNMAKLITIEEISPASGLVSILKKQSVYVESHMSTPSEPRPKTATAKRRVRFKVPDDNYESEIGGGDSCLLLFLLCLVTVVISVGGTAFYCAFGDKQSSVCQDFTRNADFYIGQLHRGMLQIQHWFTPGS